MITNPEYLPKDRLKQELKKHGVTFNPNENKDYYVQLYYKEVMQGKEPERGRSEFSSDEEFVKQSPRPSKKQTKVCVRALEGVVSGGHYLESGT
jgi:hypothetical protein